MRLNIEVNEKLISDAMKATGHKTKGAVIEQGLRTLLRLKKQYEIKQFKRQFQWTDE